MASSQKIVVVTGVTKGLGRAMVDTLVEQGHIVWGCGRNEAAIKELQGRYAAPCDFAVVDVTSDAEVEAWASRLLKTDEVPDLLLNNAGVINANAPLWEVPAEEFSQVIDVNIKGVYHIIRHFVPAMKAVKRGVIVNFSSGWGRSTAPDVAPYCATKWAIEGLSQALAQDLPRGMAAVAFSPGIIHTEMLESCFGSDAASFQTPAEWAEQAVPFLLSIRERHNGQPLEV